MEPKEYNQSYNDVCGDCKGEGEIIIPAYDYGHGHAAPEIKKPCKLCGGSGLVRVHKKTIVTVKPKQNGKR